MNTVSTEASTRVLAAIRAVRPRYSVGDDMSFADQKVIDDVKAKLREQFPDATLDLDGVHWYTTNSDELTEIIQAQI